MALGKARVARKATKRNVKGNRWIKGQSSSSNPKTNKYREAAKRGFFQLNTGHKSTLTTDALSRHDDLQTEEELCEHSQALCICDDEDADETKTFATNWTTCSNPSFESFLKNWKPHLAAHKDRLAVLAAVTEVIKQKNGKETETEYFAALLTTLDVLDNTELLTAGVTILSMVIKRVPKSVLKSKFSESSKLFQDLLARNISAENPSLLRGLLGCLSVVLRVQEAAVWNQSSTIQSFMAVLSFSTHPKPRIRKAAQHAVCSILKGSSIMLVDNRPVCHPAASPTAKFCIQQLESQGAVASTATLHILGLLKNILSVFSQHHVKTTCEAVLQWMGINNAGVTTCSFQALHGLFVNRPSRDNLSPELNAQLINALYDYQPSSKDAQNQLSWITVLREAHLNLLRLDVKLCLGHMARFFSAICRLWSSPKKEITSCITSTLKELLYSLDGSLIEQLGTLNDERTVHVQNMFLSIEHCLGYQHHDVWSCVFQVLSVSFKVLGRVCELLVRKCLRSLADLRNSQKFAHASELDSAVGQAIKTFGPRVVLESIPLNLDQESPNFEQSWLLPVLRDNLQETELRYFKQYFWPLIEKTNQRVLKFQRDENEPLRKTYEFLFNQLWSLLPGFCTSPTDLTKSFKLIAQDLGKVLENNWADYKLNILTALRVLVNKNLDKEQNRATLSKYAKNYLPILFNLYTKPPQPSQSSEEIQTFHQSGYRLSIFDTIKVYLEITDRDCCEDLFVKGLNRLSGQENPFTSIAILDLLRALLPYISKELVEKLFETCIPLLGAADRTTQKKAYRIFEELCMGRSEACREFVKANLGRFQTILVTSLSTTVPSAKAPRMRCLNHIVLQLNEESKEFLLSITPEVISCIKENAVKVRIAAVNLIINIVERFISFGGKSEQDIIQDYIGTLLAGLAGSTHLVCATVTAVSHVSCHFKERISSNLFRSLLNSVAVLGTVKTRAIVCAVLDFIKSTLSSFNDIIIASNITKIIEILTHLDKDCQKYFRMKIRRIFQRLIRTLGYEMVRDLIPGSYQKLLTYIRKQELRSKKKKDEVKNEEDDDDETAEFQSKPQSIDELLKDSSSDEEMDTSSNVKMRKKKKASTWIQEEAETEIVDLLDPKVSKNILATKPEKESMTKLKPKDEFEIAPDGRMIISDKEEKSNILDGISELKVSKRKRLATEDDDEDSVKESIVATKSKKLERMTGKESFNKKRGLSYGAEYKAKKAGGDVKKKGKPDPYAYVPLETQSLNKRKKAKLAGKFKSVVRSARKGAQLGKHARSKGRKNRN